MNIAPTPPLRVLLVDDHPAVRDALALLLTPAAIRLCAHADDCAQARLALQQATPDVVIVDLSLERGTSLELVKYLDERGVPVLAYSVHEDGEQVRRTLLAGARGYVSKREMHRVLVEAIREVAAGRVYLGPRAAAALAVRLARMGERGRGHGLYRLTEREREVYSLLGEGISTAQIAVALHVSGDAVESCCACMMRKLGLDSMRTLCRQAVRDTH